uniref:Uncharacterized protein n=1 Tax=Rhizophora mucronata TaxID=61149 RepID=A0A2P2NUV2_RHIMU
MCRDEFVDDIPPFYPYFIFWQF